MHAKNEAPDGPPRAVKREVSKIAFPYNDLDDAALIVKAVYNIGGQSCGWEQLAAVLKVVPTGGGFRARLSQARIFGLLDYGQGAVTLTRLGLRLADPMQADAARADAFLAVPLYRAIYECYKGYTVPAADALETEIARLGVSLKQTDKARQVFERSAKQAGFHWAGGDRLTLPITRGEPDKRAAEAHEDPHKTESRGAGGESGLDLDPLLIALLRKIPRKETGWPKDQRLRWFRTFAMNVSQVYDEADAVDLTIAIQSSEETNG